jgi:transposase-like protein
MGRPHFTPGFREEAVRQVIERGHSVVDVASRLGVSSHSLYKWVKDANSSTWSIPGPPRVRATRW